MKKYFNILFLPIISASLFALVYIQELTPKLGLDLQGGISVILTADDDTDQELIEQAVEIMRTRIEAFGDVQEPEIAISGENSVLVQLPGVTDQERAIEALGTTGLLTFRPVLDSSLTTGYSPALSLEVNPDDPEDVSTKIKEGVTGVDEVIGISIKDNAAWSRFFCIDLDSVFSSGDNFVSLKWVFKVPLCLPEGYSLNVRMNDNLSGLVEHYFNVQGFKVKV